MEALACFLDGFGSTEEECRQNRDESIKLLERILAFCTDDKIRNRTPSGMCLTLWRNGEKERALEIARSLPNVYSTEEVILPRLLEGEEKINFCQGVIEKLHWEFWWLINRMLEEDYYSSDEKIALLRKSIAFYEVVDQKEDYGFSHVRLADAYESITELLLKQNKVEEGLDSLEKCVEHYVAFDTLPDCLRLSSLLVNTLEYRKEHTSKSTQNNGCREMLNGILRDLKDSKSIYHQCEKDDKFKKIIEKLQAIAN